MSIQLYGQMCLCTYVCMYQKDVRMDVYLGCNMHENRTPMYLICSCINSTAYKQVKQRSNYLLS